MEPSKKPINLLNKKINNDVLVRLKNNAEYRGKMVDCDTHMNLIMEEAKEFRNNSPTTVLGKIILRGNNILYICVDPQQE